MEPKERIRAKAHEIFLRYGIRSISMDEIATQLGVSKKTIYQFFADKDALVDDIIADEIKYMEYDCLQCGLRARDAVDEIMITMVQVLEQFSNMNPIVIHDLQKYHNASYQRIVRHKSDFLLNIISNNIERGIQEGLYRPEINVEIMSRFHVESMMIAFNIELYTPKKFNLVEVTRELIEHYVFGLATPKGYEQIRTYRSELNNKMNKNEN